MWVRVAETRDGDYLCCGMPALTIKAKKRQRRAAGQNAVSNRQTMFRRDGGGIAVFTAMKGGKNGGMWCGPDRI